MGPVDSEFSGPWCCVLSGQAKKVELGRGVEEQWVGPVVTSPSGSYPPRWAPWSNMEAVASAPEKWPA